MQDEINEIRAKKAAKQIFTYADAITVFSFVQTIAFSVALGQAEFRKSVLRAPCIVVFFLLVAYFVYFLYLRKCREGITALLGPSKDSTLSTWHQKLWNYRFSVLALGFLLSLLALV